MDILEHFVQALQVRIGFQVQLTPQTLYLPPRINDWMSEPRGPFLGAPPPSSRSRPYVLLGECDGACRGLASWNFLHGNMVFLSLVSLDGWGHEQWGEALYSGPAGCGGGCARSRRPRGSSKSCHFLVAKDSLAIYTSGFGHGFPCRSYHLQNGERMGGLLSL